MGLETGLRKVIGKIVLTPGIGTSVTFRRVTMGTYDVKNSKVNRSTSDTSLKGVLSSVNQREVNELIQGDDLKLMIAADALTVEPSTVDELIMSGVGQNDTSGAPKPPGKYQNAGPAKGSNYQVGKEKVGNTYYVHNNLPYAEPVVFGTSLPPSWGGKYRSGNKKRGEAPKQKVGWIDLIEKDLEDRGKQLWRSWGGK